MAKQTRRVDTDTKDELKKRLVRIEGQVRGVARMLEDERDCQEIIQQLSAIRSAVQQVSLTVARSYAWQCLSESASQKDPEALVEDLINVLNKAS